MIKLRSFFGGVFPKEGVNGKAATAGMQVRVAAPPQKVAILLSQHTGAPCQPLVKPGERVLLGQKIGEPEGHVGAPVHASVSGKVIAIKPRFNAQGLAIPAILIENDGLDEWDPGITPKNPDAMSDDALINCIREAGVVGLGGAAFPTAVKLAPPRDKPIDTLILNGAECEPYLTSDHRTMLEQTEAVLDGLLLARRILDAKRALIGVEENKSDALAALAQGARGQDIEVVKLPARYPQGGERQLIQSLTGRQVPSGGLPMDVSCVVINVSTAAAISMAVREGKPIVARTVTVTGLVPHPQNLRVRVGESLMSLVEQCGGMEPGANKLVAGGPMMGTAIFDMETPVVKATSGILVMKDDAQEAIGNCIRCGRCMRVCPARLMPLTLHALSMCGRFERARQEHARDCIECGSCAYVCPAKLPLVQSIRVAKREIQRIDNKDAHRPQ